MTTDDGLLFTGGTLFDGHRYVGAGEVLVRDGRVVTVGPAEGRVDPDAAAGAEVVDLAGGLLAPGFVDAHVHPVLGGLERIRCDLSEAGDRPEARAAYLDLLSSYAAAHPQVEWILGGGWAMSAFPGGAPTAAELDRAVPDRPAFLPNRDHHGAWVNTRALEVAGIDASTPDPVDGRIERGADGRPTGTLHEGAMALVARGLPPTTDEEYDAGLAAAQDYLLGLGVTGWQDALVGDYAGLDDPCPVYARAAARGTLVADVVGALWWDRDRGVEQVADLVERRGSLGGGRFRATSVKIMADGVPENGSAAMLAPYLDRCGHATTNAGHSFVAAEQLKEAVGALDAAGFQVHVHAIGDRAVRDTLDAFESTDPGRRHHVAHLQVVHPDDVPRFGALGVAANLQALWACYDEQMIELTLPALGDERASWQYPFAGLQHHGARLVMGSDWPVSTPDPLQAIHVAVNRMAYDDPGRAGRDPMGPEQALTLEAALAAYTSGSAWINHRDRRDGAGVLRPGSVADLVVLDRDPFAGPTTAIGATGVASTWVAGQRM